MSEAAVMTEDKSFSDSDIVATIVVDVLPALTDDMAHKI